MKIQPASSQVYINTYAYQVYFSTIFLSLSLSLSLYLSIYLSFSPSVAPDRENTHAHEERERERMRPSSAESRTPFIVEDSPPLLSREILVAVRAFGTREA